MDFISNKEPQIEEMLKVLNVKNIEELFEAIPQNLRHPAPAHDDGLSELEGIRLMEELSSSNSFPKFTSYLGAGSYEHHIPALISSICSKSEFLTSYTPYQPEASQGMLQSIFEFQSVICALTKMDVSNASVYDGASACAEAILMALRYHKNRSKILIAESLHPNYLAVVKQYISTHDVQIEMIPFLASGKLDLEFLNAKLSDDTAAVLVQSPNFFGIVEDLKTIAEKAKAKNSLSIASANPLSYALFEAAGALGIDIAVGDCQPLGLPLQFGGPYVGYMACKQQLLRQLPGRIVGQTKDVKGDRGYVLTLQTREQHIRRDKATSNICTNQALAAMASLIALLWYGKIGLQKLALTNFQRATYLKEELKKIPNTTVLTGDPMFNEFAIKFSKSRAHVQAAFRKENIEPGLSIDTYYPSLKNYFLVAVTETKTLADLNRYLKIARQL